MGLKNLSNVFRHIVDWIKQNLLHSLIVLLLLIILLKPAGSPVGVNSLSIPPNEYVAPKFNLSTQVPQFDSYESNNISTGSSSVDSKTIEINNVNNFHINRKTTKKVNVKLNKELVIKECIRREPRLSNYYELSTGDYDSEQLPYIGFILEFIEQKYNGDLEKLYGNINNAVYEVFQYLKDNGYYR